MAKHRKKQEGEGDVWARGRPRCASWEPWGVWHAELPSFLLSKLSFLCSTVGFFVHL